MNQEPPSILKESNIHSTLPTLALPRLEDWKNSDTQDLLSFLTQQPLETKHEWIETLWQAQKNYWLDPKWDTQMRIMNSLVRWIYNTQSLSVSPNTQQGSLWAEALIQMVWKGISEEHTFSLPEWIDATNAWSNSGLTLSAIIKFIQPELKWVALRDDVYREEKVSMAAPYFWSLRVRAPKDFHETPPSIFESSPSREQLNLFWGLNDLMDPIPLLRQGLEQNHPVFQQHELLKSPWPLHYYRKTYVPSNLEVLNTWVNWMPKAFTPEALNHPRTEDELMITGRGPHGHQHHFKPSFAELIITQILNQNQLPNAYAVALSKEESLLLFQHLYDLGARPRFPEDLNLSSSTSVKMDEETLPWLDPWGFFKSKRHEQHLEKFLLTTSTLPNIAKPRL